MRPLQSLILFAALVTVVCSCAKTGKQGRPQTFNSASTRLVTVAAEYDASNIQFGEDGRQVVTIEKRDGKSAVRINDTQGPLFTEVREPRIMKGFEQVAYIATDNGKEAVVVNRKIGNWYEKIDKIGFSPTGAVIYTAQKTGKWLLVEGSRELSSADAIEYQPVASMDGKRIAFVGQNANNRKRFVQLCAVDQSTCSSGPEYDEISEMRYDKSRMRLVYQVSKNGRQCIMTADFTKNELTVLESDWFDQINIFDISDNSQHLAFLALRNGKTLLVADGVESSIPSFDVAFDLVATDSSHVMYGVMKDGKTTAYVDGKRIGGVYGEINDVTYNSGKNMFAFSATSGAKDFLVVNGKEGPTFDKVVKPLITATGDRVVYRARDKGRRFVVVADAEGRTVREHARYDAVWEPSIAPDGKSVGYGVKQGNEFWWKVESLE